MNKFDTAGYESVLRFVLPSFGEKFILNFE